MTTSELITANKNPLEQFTAALDEADWKYSRTEDRIESGFHAGPCIVRLVAYVTGDGEELIFFASFGLLIPEVRHSDALQLLNRLNWKMAVGNYEMDERDGEIRIRSSYPLSEGRLDGSRAFDVMMNLCACASRDVSKFVELLSPPAGTEGN